jgi:23S rRNA (cytidine1920-2'-O)/16S rRNA (cytidine1409-2'-O)-methyltransferase
MLERLDKILVDQGHAQSRTQAQKLIEAGVVLAEIHGQWIPMLKAAQKIPTDSHLKVGDIAELRYVSRAGLKLELALQFIQSSGALPGDDLNASLRDASVLDIGQSTGGFTDCLLQYPVRLVVGVDVGRDQLAEKLRGNSRIVSLEGINARDMSAEILLAYSPFGFDWAVMDVSFISQTLSLIKPQFEVGAKNIAKGGMVRDTGLYQEVREKVTACASSVGFHLIRYFDSGITGGDGNREFFMLCQKR